MIISIGMIGIMAGTITDMTIDMTTGMMGTEIMMITMVGITDITEKGDVQIIMVGMMMGMVTVTGNTEEPIQVQQVITEAIKQVLMKVMRTVERILGIMADLQGRITVAAAASMADMFVKR